MHRRSFIHLSGYAALAMSAPFIQGCKRRADAWSEPLAFSHIADTETIRLTGITYRKTHPAESSEDELRKLLAASGGIPQTAGDDAVRSLLAKKTQDDFKTGKQLTINGWVLALTEARQCALFSILQS